ncbi:hypothetical protein LguiB_001780 [Lonicera macranthoides]
MTNYILVIANFFSFIDTLTVLHGVTTTTGLNRHLGMHKLIFEDVVVNDGEALSYYVGGKVVSNYDSQVSPSQFEAHGGCSQREPTTNSISLPSTIKGKWYCRYCKERFDKEKLLQQIANACYAASRVAGIDTPEEIKKRCTGRVGTSKQFEYRGCMLSGKREAKKGIDEEVLVRKL